MEKKIKTRIINKHAVESDWAKAVNFIPMQGELIVYDIDSNYDYERFKLGDGITKVKDLPFLNLKIDTITENLLGVENLSKWSIVRESDNPDTPADTEYSHYAGVVDLSKEKLEGIKGILAQLLTNSWTTSWTDFKYNEKLSLGDNFSINLTPFIQNREHAPNNAQIYEDTFVDIKFGSWSIRLFRWVRDQYREYKNWPVDQTKSPSSFEKLRVGICMDIYDPETGALLLEDTLVAYTDVVTTQGVVEDENGNWIPDPNYPTTTLCNGAPSKTKLSNFTSQLMKYIRSFCVGNCGRPAEEYVETCFQRDFGYKDIKLTFEDGKVTVTDANDKAFKFHTPMYNSDYTIADEPLLNENTDYIDLKTLADMGVIPYPETNDIDVKVRMNHDRAVSVDYPLALMRFEITKNYSTNAIDDINNTSTEAVQQAFDITRRLDSEILDLYEIEDALMIDFDNPTSAINTRAWSVTWNTENRPYGLQGIRHPIVCVSNSFKEVQDKAVMVKRWIVSITETTPNQGRQWTNIYSEEEGWSGWRSVESISSHLPISKGGTGFGTPAEARKALGAAETFNKILTVGYNNWLMTGGEEDKSYYTEIECPGLLMDDTPIVDVITNLGPYYGSGNDLVLEAWSHIAHVNIPEDGLIILFTDGNKPQVSFQIVVKVVR